MKNIFILSAVVLPLSFFSQASVKKANDHYNNYSYSKVIDKLAEKDDVTTDGLRKLAESYKMTMDYVNAEAIYAKVVAAPDKTPEDIYAYAQVLKMNTKYNEAQNQMDAYAGLKADDSRVGLFNQNKNYIAELLKDKGQFQVKNLSVNSPEQDFGVTYFKEQIVYTSSKHDINAAYRRWNGNNLPYLDLYIGKEDANAEIIDAKKLSSLNKKYHEGPASYSKDGSTVMYTQDNYKERSSDGIRKLEIYESKFKDGKWSERVPFPFNNKEYSVGHPALSTDGNTLYFSSDMPGGKGGVDLYRSVRGADGKWGQPENLGAKINTEGNEMFPYVHENGLLFFSSDGRPGLGGLDVFATEIKNATFSKVINVGAPVNGSKDDFSFVLNPEKSKGYFASNREGGKGDDDIYSFNLLKPFKFGKTIKGTAKDKDGNSLAATTVNLYDASGKVIHTVTTTENGSYLFEVEAADKYRLVGNKEKYFEGTNAANIDEESDVVVSDVILEKDPGLSLIAIVTDAISKQPLEGVKMTIIDAFTAKPFDNVTTTSTGEYRKPLYTNKIGDRIGYKIKLEKSGYLTKEVVFNYEITKPGEIRIHDALDLSLGKLEVGGDLAKMIDIKPIYFDLGKYTIRKDAAVELDKIVKVMNDYPNMVVELGSHTDCRASSVFNMKLSDNRAKASAAYIKKKISSAERIYGKGYGESKLKNGCACEGTVKSTCSEDEHQANRRTEFIIIKLE